MVRSVDKRPFASVALNGILAVCVLSVAQAQSKDVIVRKLEQINAHAMENYDALEFDAAKRQALEGLQMANEAQVDGDPVAAKLHVTLGIVYVAGLKDSYRGFQEFRRALQIDPTAQIDPSVATPELQEIFQNARDSIRPEPVRPVPLSPVEPSRPVAPVVQGIVHTPIDEARAGFPIVVSAEVGDDVGARRVSLYYRTQGREEFSALEMISIGRRWSAQIPADAVRGRSLHYYIEAVDVRGRPVAQNGSAASPNVVSLTGGAGIVSTLTAGRGRARDGQATEKEARPRKWTFGVGVGTGAGLVGFASKSENIGANSQASEFGCRIEQGSGCEPVLVTTGLALAPLHLNPEIAFRVAELWQIGVLGRIQLISGNEFSEFDKTTYLGELRVKRYFSEDDLRFFLSGGAGGGQMTHGVNLGADGGNRRDTLTAGKFVLGFGGGVNYDFTDAWGLLIELNTLVLLPDNPTVNLDVTAGGQVRF